MKIYIPDKKWSQYQNTQTSRKGMQYGLRKLRDKLTAQIQKEKVKMEGKKIKWQKIKK